MPICAASSCVSFELHASRIFTDELNVPSARGLAQSTTASAELATKIVAETIEATALLIMVLTSGGEMPERLPCHAPLSGGWASPTLPRSRVDDRFQRSVSRASKE